MNRIAKVCFTMLILIGFVSIGVQLNAEEPAGKAIFLSSKCNTCHSIDSLQIARTTGKKTTETGPPDLSTVGSKHKADWMAKFLLKEEAAASGKKHMKQFTGKPEELQTLTSWLETLKK